MKKFIEEFKKFIQKGNVMDMAVGLIIGSAFTAIVTALSNGILKPLINAIIFKMFGKDNSIETMYTMLVPAYTQQEVLDEAGVGTGVMENVIDLANSIYIDWGGLISAIINFVLIAIVLFLIIKTFNAAKEANDEFELKIKKKYDEKYRKNVEEKIRKIRSLSKRQRRKMEEEEKAKALAEIKAAEEAKQRELEALEPTTNDLLKAILAELQNKGE